MRDISQENKGLSDHACKLLCCAGPVRKSYLIDRLACCVVSALRFMLIAHLTPDFLNKTHQVGGEIWLLRLLRFKRLRMAGKRG